MADSQTTREILRNRYSGGPHNLGTFKNARDELESYTYTPGA